MFESEANARRSLVNRSYGGMNIKDAYWKINKKLGGVGSWEESKEKTRKDKERMDAIFNPIQSKINTFAEKTEKIGKSIRGAGWSMTVRITIPLTLFFLGLVTFPLGIIFWIIGLAVMFRPKK